MVKVNIAEPAAAIEASNEQPVNEQSAEPIEASNEQPVNTETNSNEQLVNTEINDLWESQPAEPAAV